MVTNAICGTVLLGLLLVIRASAPAQQNFELYQKGLERDQNEQGRRDRMEQMNKDMKIVRPVATVARAGHYPGRPATVRTPRSAAYQPPA